MGTMQIENISKALQLLMRAAVGEVIDDIHLEVLRDCLPHLVEKDSVTN